LRRDRQQQTPANDVYQGNGGEEQHQPDPLAAVETVGQRVGKQSHVDEPRRATSPLQPTPPRRPIATVRNKGCLHISTYAGAPTADQWLAPRGGPATRPAVPAAPGPLRGKLKR